MPTLQFKGKSLVWNHHLSVPFHTLDDVNELDFQTEKGEGNLIIEGDNLVALKALIPEFQGKIKCIYIDPPYNTGNEGWIYNDKVNSPMISEWLGNVVGSDDLTKHDKWLCMMVPRLKLLRDLLSDDGVMFISIDDNEVHHLRQIMNEIFGEENFVAELIWNTGRKSIAKLIATNHEYCLIYSKNISLQISEEMKIDSNNDNISKSWREKKKGLDQIYSKYYELKTKNNNNFEKVSKGLKLYYDSLSDDNPSKAHKHYKYADERGIFFPDNISQGTGDGGRFDIIHPITKKPCKVPEGGWRFSENTKEFLLKENRIMFGDDETKVPNKKTYLNETEFEVPSSVFYKDARGAKMRLKSLFDNADIFQFPKDDEIIKKFIRYCTNSNDIILDSFAGSGTTMHAVMALNKEDGGNRKCIMIQMPESNEKEPEKNIAKDITRERVKRAIEKYEFESGFSYKRVGSALDIESLLTKDDELPSYEKFADYVFYLAMKNKDNAKKNVDKDSYYIGGDSFEDVYLVYENNFEKLMDLALNLSLAEKIVSKSQNKRKIVYTTACFLEDEYLKEHKIDFVQIPFSLFERK